MPPYAARVEQILAEQSLQLHLPGVAFAIVQDDRVVFTSFSGCRDLDRKQPVTIDTVFPIGSCTKAFTSMAVARSADRGLLSLDDHPRKFLPWFHMWDAEADAQVTIRDMLSHRTGLKPYADLAAEPGVLTREEYVRAATAAKPVAEFRSAFQYSNAMYSAAGLILGRAHATTWEEVIRSEIFAPLAMHSSFVSASQAMTAPQHATGYVYDTAASQFHAVPPPRSLDALAPGGNIASSTRDLTHWLRVLTSGGSWNGHPFVSPQRFRDLITPLIRLNATTSYALGWATYDWNGLHVVEHNGGSEGISALISFIPERRIGLVFLSNTSPNLMTRVGTAGELLWPVILGMPAPPKESAATAPAADTQSQTPATSDVTVPTSQSVIAQMIQAAGGEENLRRHTSSEIRARKSYDSQGVVADLEVQQRAPAMHNEREVWAAAGRQIATVRVYFDGSAGGQETTFGQDELYDAEAIARSRRDYAMHPLLDVWQLYDSITVRAGSVADQPVWLVDLKPHDGAPVEWAVSQKSLLLMQQKSGSTTMTFSDYRNVDGEMVPFRTTVHDALGESTIEVTSVRFNDDIADAVFRPAK